jgi:hypothetical protein
MPTDNSAPSLRSTAEALSLPASILGSVVIYSEARRTFTHHSQGSLEMRGRRIGNALQRVRVRGWRVGGLRREGKFTPESQVIFYLS